MSAWTEYKKKLGTTRPWDVLDKNKLLEDDGEVSTRMSHCASCPEFINATKQCKQCGCIMTMKTRLKEATCPLGKW